MNIPEFLYHIPHDDDLRMENYPEKNKNDTNKTNESIIQEYDCGCLSTYTTVVKTHKYTELVRNK